MNFYKFDKDLMSSMAKAQDDANSHDTSSSEKGRYVQEDDVSISKRILSAEELEEHRKHCKAKPGNCPYEKVYNEIDEVKLSAPKITKTQGYDRLAVSMTQMYALASELAQNDMANESNDSKKIVEVIEGGLNKIQELCADKNIHVLMDKAKTKYIIKPPID